MPVSLRLDLYQLLACPYDQAAVIHLDAGRLQCSSCGAHFPIHGGVPVLLNESRSLFSAEVLIGGGVTTVDTRPTMISRIRKSVSPFLPKISCNTMGRENCERLRTLLLKKNPSPVVLVIGSGEIGEGLDVLTKDSAITLVESDVYFSGRVNVIGDAHDLPFLAGSFDAVVCQAVLEHVLNPARCVSELHRVLRDDGLVYAETPFMQQVHMGAYDFTRFTLSGHRYLFRNFREESSGVVCGPGMALAWSILYFCKSFSTSTFWHLATHAIVPLFTFWFKYFDYFLIPQPSAADAASGFFFLGRKSATSIPDRDIVKLHWSWPR